MYKRINELLGTEYKSDSDIDWSKLSIVYKLSESFIREFKDKVVWHIISQYQVLSENFIREFEDKVDWYWISISQNLSESFIREFKDRVDWDCISNYQTLSENFIREFKDRVNWIWISENQILSWNFILEFENKVYWIGISRCQPFIDSTYKKVNEKILKENKLYQLYQKTKERGWFVGYILLFNNNKNIYYFNSSINNFELKAKIYWKNIINVDRVNNFKPLRNVKFI